ncbi:MAG: FMN-binding protein [Candidatus Paceibacterota bacterium]|jgi:uncharacterized protein with FMN-binding domain
MKKFLLSFVFIIAFTFYAILSSSKQLGIYINNLPVGDPASKSAPTSDPQPDKTITPAPPTSNPKTTKKPPQPAPTPTPTPSPKPAPTPPPAPKGIYRDGSYTGTTADAYYGNVQVAATIQGGRLTDVQFLQYPSDRRTSIQINTQAMPYLITEAIQAQNAQVDIVSGATDTSNAFIESLGSALAQAKN